MADLTNMMLFLIVSLVSLTAAYDPDNENVYHLFTRANPTVSQPLLPGNLNLLSASNFDPNKGTVCLIHGGWGSVTADFNTVVAPAFLSAQDVNVIAFDWSGGSFGPDFQGNVLLSGESAARFLNWLNLMTGASPDDYRIVGYSLGAHQAGIVGRNINGTIGNIIPLDPANNWLNNENKFRPDDGKHTEAVHTSAGEVGIGIPVAQVDFYPNGGNNMPGCATAGCNHDRAYFYYAESIISGGFTGQKCATYEDARAENCNLPETLQLGGLLPKNGSTGLFHVTTNAGPPFSQG